MQSVVLQSLVAAMMIAVGLELTPDDLAAASRRVRWFGLALVLNLLLIPVGVWAASHWLPLSAGWVAGMVLLVAAPGGPVGPVLARLGDADLGFSTGLMVLLGLVSLVSAPLTVTLMLDTGSGETLFWPMFQALLVFQVVPLTVAMYARRALPTEAARLVKPFRVLSNVLLVGIVVGLVATRGGELGQVPVSVHLAIVVGICVVLAPMMLATGDWAVIRGLSVVSAIRNISVALLLAATFFDDPDVEVAILVCSFWMLVLPVIASLAAKAYGRRPAPQATLGASGHATVPGFID